MRAPGVGSDARSWPTKCGGCSYFNPRSPCGERQGGDNRAELDRLFQSTLPVWGATVEGGTVYGDGEFQSTLPVWGATGSPGDSTNPGTDFNPRSPCGERHERGKPVVSADENFNPRSPCGERH